MSQQINLFTQQFRKRIVLLSAELMAAGAGMVLLLALAFSAWLYVSVTALKPQAEASSRAVSSAQSRLAALMQERDPVIQAKALDSEISHLENTLKDKREVVDMLKSGAIGDTQGYSDYLRAIARQIVDGLWITAFDIAAAGRHFTLEGSTLRADLVPQYIKRLSGEPAMQGRRFAMLSLQAPKPAAGSDASGNEPLSDNATKERPKPSKPYLDFRLSSALLKTKENGTAANSGTPLEHYVEFAKAAQQAVTKETP